MRDRADRILRGRQADAQQSVAAQGGKALERERKMRAALVRRDRMDFVDDRRARSRQHLAPRLRAEQDVERFRSRHQDVGRAPAHPLALGGRRVAGAHPCADLDIRRPAPPEFFPNAGERRFQVAVNVVRQGLERRDVNHLGRVGQAPFEPLADEVVDGREERGERLARAGRRGDQSVAPGLDGRPGFCLRGGRRVEGLREPRRDRGVEQLLDLRVRSRRKDMRPDAAWPERFPAGSQIQR